MQSARIGDIVVHHRYERGSGDGPTLVFINSLGTDFRIWDDVIAALDGRYESVRYDKRGHGLSSIGSSPCTMADHARDLIGLFDVLGVSQAVLCGASVGGQIAQELYFRRPDLVQGLLFCGTAAKIGEPAFWHDRMTVVAEKGLASITDAVMERWFSPRFRSAEISRYQLSRAMFERQPASGYLHTCAAIAAFDRRDRTASIAVPTRVMAGEVDGATPPEQVEAFAREIPGARFHLVPGAGHLPCIEAPDAVAGVIAELMNELIGR